MFIDGYVNNNTFGLMAQIWIVVCISGLSLNLLKNPIPFLEKKPPKSLVYYIYAHFKQFATETSFSLNEIRNRHEAEFASLLW